MELKQHGWERLGDPATTLRLFLTPNSLEDPQITYENVSNLLSELAEYESVGKNLTQLKILEYAGPGTTCKAEVKFASPITASLVQEKLNGSNVPSTKINVQAVFLQPQETPDAGFQIDIADQQKSKSISELRKTRTEWFQG